MSDWLTLLSTARRMANLTQEDFAADLGTSRSTLGHWENGRRPIPRHVKRRILDFMGGYYQKQPDFNQIFSSAEASGRFVTLYRQGAVVQDATTYAKQMWRRSMKSEMPGQAILPLMRNNMRFLEFYDKYYAKMLTSKTEIASVSYVDESLLRPGVLVKSFATSVAVGEGRILRLENIFLPEDQDKSILNEKETVITMD